MNAQTKTKRNYLKEENRVLKKKIKELETYMRGFTDAVYYCGGNCAK